MDTSVSQRFSSRAGLLLSALGIAIGTGNIWRFPRIAAQNGGEEGAGALIIAWIVFLFLWSIPLIIAEYLIGNKQRAGTVKSFTRGIGSRYSWMGGFVAFVATAISFFYTVIVSWALYYFVRSLFFDLPTASSDAIEQWNHFHSGFLPFILHFLVILIAGLSIFKGIKSIEKINKILIPSLLIIILSAVFKAITLPGSGDGIAYLFNVQWSQLLNPSIWLQALTQNAWDTGAGWGLFLCYAAYMKMEHGTVKNAFITGIGNNVISLIMAIMIFGTVFSVLHTGMAYSDAETLEVMKKSGPASTGLTFIWMPILFAKMSFGKFFATLFFLGLSFAGFSSLISMFELSSRVLVDRGIKRRKAVSIVCIIVYLLGLPSVFSLNFLSNQDFVWGIALMISGALIAVYAIKYGIDKMRAEAAVNRQDFRLGLWWKISLKYIIPSGTVVLLIWWIYLSATVFAPGKWFNPFHAFSVMTCLLQWVIVAGLLIGFNHRINKG